MELITRLTKKDVPFKWDQEQEESFNTMLAAITNAIVCVYPDPNLPYATYPDTLKKYPMRAILMQVQGGVVKL